MICPPDRVGNSEAPRRNPAAVDTYLIGRCPFRWISYLSFDTYYLFTKGTRCPCATRILEPQRGYVGKTLEAPVFLSPLMHSIAAAAAAAAVEPVVSQRTISELIRRRRDICLHPTNSVCHSPWYQAGPGPVYVLEGAVK